MVEKEAPASTALTVSDSTRTPTRNICSRPMMRTRSTTSSSEAPTGMTEAIMAWISLARGKASKKPGSSTASSTAGGRSTVRPGAARFPGWWR